MEGLILGQLLFLERMDSRWQLRCWVNILIVWCILCIMIKYSIAVLWQMKVTSVSRKDWAQFLSLCLCFSLWISVWGYWPQRVLPKGSLPSCTGKMEVQTGSGCPQWSCRSGFPSACLCSDFRVVYFGPRKKLKDLLILNGTCAFVLVRVSNHHVPKPEANPLNKK